MGQPILDITDFGAKRDVIFNNAKYIQSALDSAGKTGGIVYIPYGTFYTGTLHLRSNSTLRLGNNAVLKGMPYDSAYPMLGLPYFGALNTPGLKALLYSKDAVNVTIEGYGAIDGNGGSVEFANYPYINAEGKRNWHRTDRPQGILFVHCRNIRLKEFTLRNTAAWGIHILGSRHCVLEGLFILNQANANNDGIDIDGSEDVLISKCVVDSDDDAICIKTKSCIPVRNVLIDQCILSSKWNAFKIGTETYADISNIKFTNSIIKPSDSIGHFVNEYSGTGVSILSTDGAHVKDITIQNIHIDGYMSPIFIRLGSRGNAFSSGKSKPIGSISDILIEGLTARNSRDYTSSISGLNGHPLKNVTLRNVIIDVKGGMVRGDFMDKVPEPEKLTPMPAMFGGNFPASGLYCRNVDNLLLDRVFLNIVQKDIRPSHVFENVSLGVDKTLYVNGQAYVLGGEKK